MTKKKDRLGRYGAFRCAGRLREKKINKSVNEKRERCKPKIVTKRKRVFFLKGITPFGRRGEGIRQIFIVQVALSTPLAISDLILSSIRYTNKNAFFISMPICK